jgi:hypothetical protein
MTEHQPHDLGEEKKKELLAEDSDVIELSDIAIGTTAEDDAIVELTEEVIDEAMVGISGAIRDSFKEGEEFLDLTKVEPDKESRFQDKEGVAEFADTVNAVGLAEEDEDGHITKELDDFFGAEEEHPAPVEKLIQPAVAQAQSQVQKADQTIYDSNLVEALETVIKKIYGDKINQILSEVIEKTVKNELNRIKDFLAGKTQK